ncbi:hypothetical protein GE09DRAFT_1158060 [Coniochaeta sp. 2T2.1]|nr:hypothetical protein GE09DRAFT_1158060 [Coniochaeta sp. 2T2.1]
MPLPPSLTTTYHQYKHDTDVVASWLAHMGERVGCPTELLSSTTGATGSSAPAPQKPAPSLRLKGKARKQAKAGAAAAAALAPDKPSASTSTSTATTPSPTKPKYVLAIRNFVPLAEFISSSEVDESKVDVPTTFTTAIERAISVRRSFVNLLEQHGINPELDSNAKHSFFVGVLEKVRDVLKPLFWKPTPGGKKDKPDVPDAIPITHEAGVPTRNPFEILEVYDVPELNLEVESDQTEKAAAEAKQEVLTVDYRAEETKDEEGFESFLAFCSLFRDITAIRDQVRRLWLEYARNSTTNKTLSLSAVAVATNTAIEIARRMEEDLAHLFNKMNDGVHGMLLTFYTAECVARGKDPLDIQPPAQYNMSTYNLVDRTMNNAATLLRGWSDSNPGDFSTYNGRDGWAEIDFDWQYASNKDRWQQDKSSLMEMFPEFDMIGRTAFQPVPKEVGGNGQQLMVIDELTRGLHVWLASGGVATRRKNLSLWLVLATSIHWDIRRALIGKQQRQDLERPYREMMAVGAAIRDSIEATMEYHKNLKIVGWTAEHQKHLIQLQAEVKFWDNNPLFKALRMAGGGSTEENLFLKRHPWYCGLWIHDVRTRFHHLGLALERAFGGILYTGHLYNAMERQQLISQKWQDMELFYQLQGGRDKFFVGEAPTDPADFHKQLCMMMGFSASNFTKAAAQKRNKGKMTATKAGPRSLNPQARVSSMWLLSLTAASPRLNFTPEDVQAILEGGKSSRQKDTTTEQVTAADLIRDLARALQKDVPEITADYFSFHRTCWSLLRDVRAAVYDDLLKWLGTKDFDGGEYQLPFIVAWIFRTVQGNAGPDGGSGLPGIMPTLGLLQKAARAYDRQAETLREGWTYFELRRLKMLASVVDLSMKVPEIDDSVPTFGDPLDSKLLGLMTSKRAVQITSRPSRRPAPQSHFAFSTPSGGHVVPDFSDGPTWRGTLPNGMNVRVEDANQLFDGWDSEHDEEEEEMDSRSDDEYEYDLAPQGPGNR